MSQMSKTIGEVQKFLSSTKIKGEQISYWKYFEEQMDSEGTWDNDFLDEVIVQIQKLISKYDDKTYSNLWFDSIAFKEFRGDKITAPKEKTKVLLSEELLDRVMDKLETDDYFSSSAISSARNNSWNDDDEDDDFASGFDIDDESVGDDDSFYGDNF